MRVLPLAILLSSGAMALAQQSAPGVPSPDQLFQLPSTQGLNHPKFKFEVPNGGHGPLVLPTPNLIDPRAPATGSRLDPGMVIHPPQGSFVDRQPRRAQSSNLYPNLRILPTETAQLEPALPPWPKAGEIPIPITWPNAKMEPIPITWDKFTMAPVGTGGDAAKSGAIK